MKKFFMELLPSWHQPKVMPSRYCYRPRPKIASSFFSQLFGFWFTLWAFTIFYFPKWRAINIISCNVETMLLSPNMVHLDSGPKMPKMVGIFNACTFARETLHTCHVSIFLALWIVSMMILLLLALTFCNSNPWIQFSGSKFKRFLFEICQRRSNPPWQGSCPGQEPTFPTTGPDVLLLLLLHNISPSKPPQKVFWSLTAQKKLTLGLKPFFPKQKWAKILWTGGGHKVEWAHGIMARPPTPEFHFLLVFAGNSNSTISTKKNICV